MRVVCERCAGVEVGYGMVAAKPCGGASVAYMLTIWIERLLISERVMQKIIDVHGINPSEARAAVERVEGLDFSWVYEPERGRSNPYVIVRTQIQDKDALVVVYPTDNPADNEWRLGSVYHVDG